MPKGSKDGSVYKRTEKRITFKGKKREVKNIEQWYARVRYIGADGLSHEKKRRADNYAHACELKREILKEIEEELNAPPEEQESLTFGEFAETFKAEYMVPPQYIADKKVAGLRSHEGLQTFFNPLVKHFGEQLLFSITHAAIKDYKSRRLSTPAGITKNNQEGRQRSVAAVNRELQLLRRILNVAQHRGLIQVNPFRQGDPLIIIAHEVKRMRILSHDEEPQLLAACGERMVPYKRKGKEVTARDKGERRRHLRVAIICALDTALRANEQFSLRRSDVELEERVIRVREMNAKTARERFVPISDRLLVELKKLLSAPIDEEDPRLFPHDRVRRSFTNACRSIKLLNFRWHDLRHTAIMWMLESGMPESEVMKISGHTNWTTFLRYVNLNKERLRAMARMMDARRAQIEEEARRKEEQETVH